LAELADAMTRNVRKIATNALIKPFISASPSSIKRSYINLLPFG